MMVARNPEPTVAEAKRAGRPSDRGRILRMNDVIATIGLSRASIYRLVKRKAFPAPEPLTHRAVGWREADVIAWIERSKAA